MIVQLALVAACVVDSASVGGIRLDMTLGSARSAIPGIRLERATDGDGAALVDVKRDTVGLMTLYALEDDAEAPIDWTKAIHSIETFHSSCRTASGVHAGLTVRAAERVLGRVVRIIMSEVESRQYVTFANQPEWLTIRIDYTGVFPPDKRETTAFDPNARIFSISISK
jgi:hypothetical protein